MHGWAKRWSLFGLVLFATVLYRVPVLINARGVHSDAAVVGLQAMHVLRGEWSWYLWGAGYQGAIDPLLTSLVFAFTGPSPLALMVIPLFGHLLLTWLAFDVLRKRIGVWLAFVAVLVLVVNTRAINGVVLYPPRQWCITTIVAAVWLLDSASEARWPPLRLVVGMVLIFIALFFDLFALQFSVGLILFACACCCDGAANLRQALRRGVWVLVGLLLGFGIYSWLRLQPGATSNTAGLALDRIPFNFRLLWQTCLPNLLGYGKLPLPDVLWQPWKLGWIVRGLQMLTAAIFMLAILGGGLSIFFTTVPWKVRRLGALGCAIAISSLSGFLVSTMPADVWSARYLAPIIWMAPFALAPVAVLLGKGRFSLALTPYLLVAAVAGWLGFWPYVHGPLPSQSPRGVAREEAQLGDVLHQRGVKFAKAPYWISYRLAFLWQEQIAVTPFEQGLNRYEPYQWGFDVSPNVALIFYPPELQGDPAPYEAEFIRNQTPYERLEVGGYVVLLIKRTTPDIQIVPAAGWSKLEAWGMWGIGTQSSASWLAISRGNARLNIAVQPLCVKDRQQRLSIRINGLHLLTHAWQDCSVWHATMLVPAEMLRRGWNNLDFDSDYALPARTVVGNENSTDERMLAFALLKASVESLDAATD